MAYETGLALKDPEPRAMRALPGAALCVAGAGVLWLAMGQPAWVDGRVGPGLMAQLLGAGIMALGGLWAVWQAVQPRPACAAGCGTGQTTPAPRWSAPALLGAVLVFALSVPALGIVLSASLAATLAALGAGERRIVALGVTVAGLAALTAGIGLLLLPPTAPLWPAF